MPKRTEKKSPSSGATEDTTLVTKPPKTAWKTGAQLGYLLTHWSGFISHQNAGTLDRFWPRVYDGWYATWPITATPLSITKWDTPEAATLMLRSENNQVRATDSPARTIDNLFTFLTRGFVRGSTTVAVQLPGLRNPICDFTKTKNENSLPPKLTVPMPGILVFGRSLSTVGSRKSRPR